MIKQKKKERNMVPTERSRMKLKILALTDTYATAKRTIAMLTADLEETALRLRVRVSIKTPHSIEYKMLCRVASASCQKARLS